MTTNRPKRAAITRMLQWCKLQRILNHERRNTCSYLTENKMHTFTSKIISFVRFFHRKSKTGLIVLAIFYGCQIFLRNFYNLSDYKVKFYNVSDFKVKFLRLVRFRLRNGQLTFLKPPQELIRALPSVNWRTVTNYNVLFHTTKNFFLVHAIVLVLFSSEIEILYHFFCSLSCIYKQANSHDIMTIIKATFNFAIVYGRYSVSISTFGFTQWN